MRNAPRQTNVRCLRHNLEEYGEDASVCFPAADGNRMQSLVIMMTALNHATSIIGAFFLGEEKNDLAEEIRRVLYTAHKFAALTPEYIIADNRYELHRKPSLPFTANENDLSGRAHLYSTIFIEHVKK